MSSIKDFERIRKKIVNPNNRSVKITKLSNSIEGTDANCSINCNGFGRIRRYHSFRLFFDNTKGRSKKLLRGLSPDTSSYSTQVFQIEGCNIRCWYCYVDDSSLNANSTDAEWITVDELMDLFFKDNSEPYIIDLSGGQPDIVPEWCYWIMQEVEKRGMKGKVYIWVDDNLTTVNCMEHFLTNDAIHYMASFPKHSRTCCFKGYDELSYQFNARDRSTSLKLQLDNFRKLLMYGFDLYAYVTLTGPKGYATYQKIEQFVNELQSIHSLLPLRTIPLIIDVFNVTSMRMNPKYEESLVEQQIAFEYWDEVLNSRFSNEIRMRPYEEIKLLL